ncbi:ABC transporter substrate-binding protein [Salinarimonas soli]|uniref:ABC transporter substrate-binding protein n=1 Tax=Salinarimonas soli TaxID=1638099 RepID=A0A5B2VZK1_9HYPH|nr:ABC transporter substrate-binding protein [Salinarimonas soli]KAA2244254.1 ABC transporter substrate-binding protein [Salinarimonas soli]
MRVSKLRTILMAGAVALLGGAGARPALAQALQVAVDASPAGLDPHIITAFASFQIVNGTIYESLTSVDKDLRVVPGLAESWAVSPDGKTYTFKLRSGVTFHNGAPMQAADVVASLERVRSKDIASPLASRLAAVDAITAADDATVTLTLKEPSAPLLAGLSSIAVVPRGFLADKDGLQRQPVGTGPFKFKEWQPNGFIDLTRHEGYWTKGEPKVESVRFNIVPESATRQVGVASGQYAILPNIDAATALQLKGRPNVQLAQTLELAYSLIGFNTSKPPFDNAKVRQAVSFALNRKEIIDAALFGSGVPGGPISPALTAWAVNVDRFPCYKTDPAKAKALIAEAGVPAPIKATMLVLPRQDIKDMAQVVQQQLKSVGIDLELKIPELGQFIQDWRNSNFDVFASTNAGAVDPDDYLYRTFRSGGSTNVFKYANPEVDKLLDEGRVSTQPEARKAAYDRVQTILACDGPAAFLAYGQLFSAVRNGVKEFEIMPNRSLGSLARTTAAGR